MSQKTKILPSIMCSSPADMEAYIREFEKCGIDAIHFDVMDGHFVPNIMLGVRDYTAIKKATQMPVDIHLMCEDPELYLDYFKPQPGDWVSFHPETSRNPYRLLMAIRDRGCRAGIVLSPGTPVEYITEMAGVLDFILVMAVNPGFAGQKMVPDHLPKLRRIRELVDAAGRQIDIIIDGNTTPENARKMIEAGAPGLVTGTSSMLKNGPEGFARMYEAYMESLSESC